MKVMEIGRAPGAGLAMVLAAAGVSDIPGLAIDSAGVVTVADDAPADQVIALRTAIQEHDHGSDDPSSPAPTIAPSLTEPETVISIDRSIGPGFAGEASAAGVSLSGIGFSEVGGKWWLVCRQDVSAERRDAVMALIDAHDPTSPENARAGEIAAVTADRDRRLASSGYRDAITGKVFQTDKLSRDNLTGVGATALALVMLGQASTPMKFIPADNQTVTLPAAEMLELIQGRIFPWVAAHFEHANDLKNQIRAGGHPDVSAGWPS